MTERPAHPHDQDLVAERALLSDLLFMPGRVALVPFVSAEDFVKPAHQYIFDAIDALHGRGEPHDMVSVTGELRRNNLLAEVGGASALTDLGDQGSGATERAGRTVVEQSVVRTQHSIGRLLTTSTPTTSSEVLALALDRLQSIRHRAEGTGRPELLRRWSAAELLAADRTFRWRVRGLIVDPTFGMIAGEEKSLKSYFSMFVSLSTAAGVPVFGHFEVDEATPVVVYVGEGGRTPYTRRLERVAAAIGVDAASLPLELVFDTAPVGTPRFDKSLRRDLEEVKPGLVTVDPWYSYHGTASDARNLHEEGQLLNLLSQPCSDAGASLQVVNHFNKGGTGRGLSRITMAGAKEWCDSWWLTSHREVPDVGHGRFKLLLEVGSRQWGGSSWELDINLGTFDEDLGEYDGEITYQIRRSTGTTSRSNAGTERSEAITELLGDHSWEFTKSEILAKIGGKKDLARDAWKGLVDAGTIVEKFVPRPEGNRAVTRSLWGLPSELGPDELPLGPGSPA